MEMLQDFDEFNPLLAVFMRARRFKMAA